MKRVRSALLALTIAASLPAVMGMGQPLPLAEGRLAFSLGQYDKAQALFQQAGDTNPQAQLWKGHAAYMRGRPEEALEAWQVAAADGSAGPDARNAIDWCITVQRDLLVAPCVACACVLAHVQRKCTMILVHSTKLPEEMNRRGCTSTFSSIFSCVFP